METGRMYTLSPSQAEQLANACAAYRSYAWQRLPPSPERNQIMRVAQTIQGRLSVQRAGTDQFAFTTTEEERQVVRVIISILLQIYGTETPSIERDRFLGELYALRVLIERRSQPTTTL